MSTTIAVKLVQLKIPRVGHRANYQRHKGVLLHARTKAQKRVRKNTNHQHGFDVKHQHAGAHSKRYVYDKVSRFVGATRQSKQTTDDDDGGGNQRATACALTAAKPRVRYPAAKTKPTRPSRPTQGE